MVEYAECVSTQGISSHWEKVGRTGSGRFAGMFCCPATLRIPAFKCVPMLIEESPNTLNTLSHQSKLSIILAWPPPE
jgi:hypothetical protein